MVKKDAENESVVAGAVFGLYAKADIFAHGEVIVKADMLLGEAMTGEDGRAVFGLDLPFGEYYIREEQAMYLPMKPLKYLQHTRGRM